MCDSLSTAAHDLSQSPGAVEGENPNINLKGKQPEERAWQEQVNPSKQRMRQKKNICKQARLEQEKREEDWRAKQKLKEQIRTAERQSRLQHEAEMRQKQAILDRDRLHMASHLRTHMSCGCILSKRPCKRHACSHPTESRFINDTCAKCHLKSNMANSQMKVAPSELVPEDRSWCIWTKEDDAAAARWMSSTHNERRIEPEKQNSFLQDDNKEDAVYWGEEKQAMEMVWEETRLEIEGAVEPVELQLPELGEELGGWLVLTENASNSKQSLTNNNGVAVTKVIGGLSEKLDDLQISQEAATQDVYPAQEFRAFNLREARSILETEEGVRVNGLRKAEGWAAAGFEAVLGIETEYFMPVRPKTPLSSCVW